MSKGFGKAIREEIQQTANGKTITLINFIHNPLLLILVRIKTSVFMKQPCLPKHKQITKQAMPYSN